MCAERSVCGDSRTERGQGADAGQCPGRRRARGGSTHYVGAQGAEGRGATGEQVAAVEWQQDLDVVLAVTLGEGGTV